MGDGSEDPHPRLASPIHRGPGRAGAGRSDPGLDGRRAPDTAPSTRIGMFGALRVRNYRLFVASQVFSSTGSWVLRIAQDWLVLSLTGSPAAVGLTTTLQFLPTVLLGLTGGLLADRYPKRRIVLFSYAGWASMAALLAALTLSDEVRAWQVQLIAAGIGILTALGTPAWQTFPNELVGPARLRSALGISSMVFQGGGIIGPAASGFLISTVGPGWSFLITALAWTAPILALTRIRAHELHPAPTQPAQRGQLRAGLRYATSRTDVLWPIILAGVFGMFTLNLPVTLAAYAKTVFHTGPGGYGLLTTTVAVGSVAGALISARQHHTRLRTLLTFAATLSTLYILTAPTLGQLLFCTLLLAIGATTLLLNTSANYILQVAAHDTIRGRIMALYLLAYFGGGAIGGLFVGTIDQHYGPQTGMLLAGAVPGTASLLIAARLAAHTRRTRHAPAAQ